MLLYGVKSSKNNGDFIELNMGGFYRAYDTKKYIICHSPINREADNE